MTRETTDGRVEDVDATVGVVEGRVAMSAQVSDVLRVSSPDRRPLSARECHATLRVAADDVRVVLDLDGDALDALAEALDRARQYDGDERGPGAGETETGP